MQPTDKTSKGRAMVITREILWTSPNGKYVVVCGPFPRGFVRSVDAKTASIAQNRACGTVVARHETTKQRFAKALAKNVLAASNEWGEVGL